MKSDSADRSDDEALLKDVMEIYGCDESPLFYMIEPASFAKWSSKDDLSPPSKSVLRD